MFSFFATEADGVNFQESEEGTIKWHNIEEIRELRCRRGFPYPRLPPARKEDHLWNLHLYTRFQAFVLRLDPS